MDFYQTVSSRRSIRKYQDKAIPKAVLTRIAEAVRLSPRGCNRQTYRLLAVTDRALVRQLGNCCHQNFIGTAPVIMALAAELGKAWQREGDAQSVLRIDLGIAAEQLMLAATAEQLGSCCIAWFDPKAADRVLELPENWTTELLFPLGYPAEAGRPAERRELAEFFEIR